MKNRFTLLMILLVFFGSSVFSQTASLPSVTASPNGEVTVPLNVTGFSNIGAIMLKIQIDPTILSFETITGAPAGMVAGVAGNVLTLSWSGPPYYTQLNGTLANLIFLYNGPGTSVMNFLGTYEVIQMIPVPFTPITLTFTNGSVSPKLDNAAKATLLDYSCAVTGAAVSVPVKYEGFGTNVGSITQKIQYDATKLHYDSVSKMGNLAGANAGATGGIVTIAWENTSGANINYPANQFILNFTYIGSTSTTLTFYPGCIITTNAAVNIPVSYFNGTVNTTAITPPVPGTITQPTCAVQTGSVAMSGLPAGAWTVTLSPGAIVRTGTGTTATISSLAPNTYTAVVTNSTGCTSTASSPFTINAAPAVPTAPTVGTITQPTCSVATGSVVLNGLPASGTWTVTINPGPIVRTGTGVTVTVTGLTANTYTAVVTNSVGCSSAASANIVINAQPATPTAPVVGAITQPTCAVATGSVVLSGLPATGTWTINPGAITGTGVSTTVSGLATGTYNFTVTNAAGCVSPASGNVVINAQPASPVATATNNGPVCVGGTLNLTGGPASMTTYAWTGPNGFTSAIQSPSITNVTSAAAGVYHLTVTNSVGCSATANTTAEVNAGQVAAASNNGPLCVGSTLILTGSPEGLSAYAWTGPNGFTSSLPNPTIANVTTAAAGVYHLTVTNILGCTGTANTTLVVNTIPEAPVVTAAGFVLTSSATDGNQWYYEGNPIAGATGHTYTVVHNTGWYWTQVTLNGCVSDTSNHVWIEVIGIQDLPSDASFNVYPVPNDGIFTASVLYPAETTFSICIFNQIGDKIFEIRDVKTINGKYDKLINLKPMPSGIYSVVFLNGEAKAVRKVVVVNR